MALCNYQVFLSFRGPDTRHNLVKYLYDRLISAGIVPFLDNEEIDYGQRISANIKEAIERSDICIPVFSLDFATSTPCLMEVAQMVKSKKKILPIFFFVEPSVVKYQLGTYGKSFAEHERKRRYEETIIQDWKNALKQIGDMKGLEFKKASLEVALEAALEKICGTKGPEFKQATLEVALEAALREIADKKRPEFRKAVLEKIDGIKGPELKVMKAALEAALEKIGVTKGPEFTKAVEAALEKIGGITKPAVEAALAETGGQFYTDLFEGFKKLDDFISDIWKLFKLNEQGVPQNLVGIDRDVEVMMLKLGFYNQDGVVKELAMTGRRVLVVWGMPRVGKTTLAKVVFHNIRHLFQGSSSLEDVRHEFEQKKVVSLQNKLIRELRSGGKCLEVESSAEGTGVIKLMFRQKRVLILLDDVDDVEQFKQIKPFAEELTWFGPGSAIILTTTKTSVIDFYKNPHPEQNQGDVFNGHEVAPLDKDRAREHFYKHAFPQSFPNPDFPPDRPPRDYENWSSEITCAVGYLPFSIETVGRHLNLYGKSDADWMETLNGLKRSPEENVGRILKKHYDGLRDHAQNAQNIFLDIACFFIGIEKTIPNYMWDALGWEPLRNVRCLEKMAFLRIGEENEFSMHNQLKLLGRQIVKNESPDNPVERSRLWDYQDVRTIPWQRQNWQGTNRVKALRVASDFNPLDDAVFARLCNLRFLELDNVDISGNCENILPSLKWLDWCGCKNKHKLFAFDMEDLVILNLCSSSIHLSSTEWGQLMQKAQSLEVLNLKGCNWVNASMEIPASSRLKCLILEGCLHLELNTINSKFENLVSFNMKGCQWVKDLPEALRFMKALKELLIDGTKIEELQFEEGSLLALETLSACDCGELREVTDSIRYLKNLKKLFLRGCRELSTLPHVFGELGQLQEMDLSDTTISELPPCVEHCKKLQVLKMARTFVEAVPEAIKDLNKLEELDFTDCGSLSGHCDIAGLSSLRILKLKCTGISEVVARDEAQFCLHILELDHDFTKLILIDPGEYLRLQAYRERWTQTSQKESCVCQNKRKRDEE